MSIKNTFPKQLAHYYFKWRKNYREPIIYEIIDYNNMTLNLAKNIYLTNITKILQRKIYSHFTLIIYFIYSTYLNMPSYHSLSNSEGSKANLNSIFNINFNFKFTKAKNYDFPLSFSDKKSFKSLVSGNSALLTISKRFNIPKIYEGIQKIDYIIETKKNRYYLYLKWKSSTLKINMEDYFKTNQLIIVKEILNIKQIKLKSEMLRAFILKCFSISKKYPRIYIYLMYSIFKNSVFHIKMICFQIWRNTIENNRKLIKDECLLRHRNSIMKIINIFNRLRTFRRDNNIRIMRFLHKWKSVSVFIKRT